MICTGIYIYNSIKNTLVCLWDITQVHVHVPVCVLICAHADMCYCSADHSTNLLKLRKIWKFYDLNEHGVFFQFRYCECVSLWFVMRASWENCNQAVSGVLGSTPRTVVDEHCDLGQSHLTSLDLSLFICKALELNSVISKVLMRGKVLWFSVS